MYHHITNCFWYIDDEQNCLFFYSIFFNIAFFFCSSHNSKYYHNQYHDNIWQNHNWGRFDNRSYNRRLNDILYKNKTTKKFINTSYHACPNNSKKIVSSHSKLPLAITDITSSTTENTLYTQKNQIQHVVQ